MIIRSRVHGHIGVFAVAMKSGAVTATASRRDGESGERTQVNVGRGRIAAVVEHSHLGRALAISHGEPIGSYANAMPHFGLWPRRITDQ